jgi:prevent-host-death family protein
MARKKIVVGASEAKTRLSELLRETEQGATFVIRRRGKTVARLVPPARERESADPAQLVALFRQIRRRVSGRVNIRELTEAGRRY